ncbi:MAG: CNNM domain-containing protein [Victivallaceae bacterium]|nr:CNNM domain-containing protein [Victivallaceae bacterium]
MTILLTAVIVAMAVSFLCSVMEAALLSLNPGKLARLTENHPAAGRICANFKNNIEKPIAVILILNTTAHTFGAAVAGAQFDKLFGSEYIWLFSLVFTILMVQYTEILPKTLGVRFSLGVMAGTAALLKCAVFISMPLIKLVHWVNRPFERGGVSPDEAADEALEELDALATAARRGHRLSPAQEKAIHRIPDLAEDNLAALMVPRAKMTCLNTEMTRSEVLAVIRREPHSRYPVLTVPEGAAYIGVLEIRRMLLEPEADWRTLLRQPAYIDAGRPQLHIAENLVALDSKLLLVRDSSGGVIGMLTVRDLFTRLFPQPATAI